MLILSGLQRDAIHWAGNCAEIAGDAALAAIGVACQNDSTAITRGQIRLFFRVLDRHPTMKAMPENFP
jgi:hypothetical protein